MKSTLGAFTYAYNMSKYDYPFEESIRSVIGAVDQFVICECKSEDDTLAIAERLQREFPDKIKIVQRSWVMDFREISAVANFALAQLTTDYAFQIQADEVMHEDSLQELIDLTLAMDLAGTRAARVHYTHFMANYETTFPFCYETLVRIVRKDSPWKIIGDGVQFAISTPQGEIVPEDDILNTNIQIFHYGKVKDPTKGWQKEWDFQQLYTDIGFPDPKMKEMERVLGSQKCDYVFLFEDHVRKGTIKRFDGTHPAVMAKRIAEFKAGGYEQFISMVKQDLEIKHGG